MRGLELTRAMLVLILWVPTVVLWFIPLSLKIINECFERLERLKRVKF